MVTGIQITQKTKGEVCTAGVPPAYRPQNLSMTSVAWKRLETLVWTVSIVEHRTRET